MGWGSGSQLMSDVISTIQSNVENKASRIKIYRCLIEDFEAHDCDTLDECRGEDPAFDRAMEINHPKE